MAKNIYTKEQNKERRNINQFKKKDKRKKEQSQSDLMPHGNQYRRQKQRDREESYNDEYDF